jgi:hypothetical protein
MQPFWKMIFMKITSKEDELLMEDNTKNMNPNNLKQNNSRHPQLSLA